MMSPHAQYRTPDAAAPPECTPDTCAIIAAGGLGLRFGDARGKQFVEVCDLPVLDWSVVAFDRAPSIAEIIVVCPENRETEARAALRRVSLIRPVRFVRGGATRQESCLAGLRAVSLGLPFVAIHDGARPLIDVDTIERVIARLRDDAELDGAICAHPSTDTLKIVVDGIVRTTPDRSRYWTIQTPQVFRTDTVIAAHETAAREGFVGTDDSSLVERSGGRVACVEGPRDNMKMTMPEDRHLMEAILSEHRRQRNAQASQGSRRAWGGR